MASPERTMTLREVCDDVSYGFTASATSEDTGVRLLRVTDIASGPVAWRSVPFCKIGPSEFQRHQLRESDIVLSRMGTVGVSAIVPPGVTAVPASYLVRFRANRAIVDPGYLFYVLNSPGWWRHVHARQTGAVQPNLNATLMGDFSFTLPSLSDQRRVAHILGTLDNKIELNRRMNAILEEMARALYKSWFVDFDPVRAKAEGRDPGLPKHLADLFSNRLVDSELGEIPNGWQVRRVDEDFDLTMGQSPPGHTYNFQGEGLPFYQGRTDFGTRFPVRRVYCTAPTRVAQEGDTLVSVRAPVGDANLATEPSALGRGVAAIRHKSRNVEYTIQAMRGFAPTFESFNAEGTVFGSIGKSDFHAITVVSPPPKVVEAFEKAAEPLTLRIRAASDSTCHLLAVREAILPILMAGMGDPVGHRVDSSEESP